METSKLKLRLSRLSVESFEMHGGVREMAVEDGRATAPGAVREPRPAPESGGATCAGVSCWATCGRTCYDTCSLLDCGF